MKFPSSIQENGVHVKFLCRLILQSCIQQKFFVFGVSFSTYKFAKNVCVSGEWKISLLYGIWKKKKDFRSKKKKLSMFMSIVLLNRDLFGLIDGHQTSQF